MGKLIRSDTIFSNRAVGFGLKMKTRKNVEGISRSTTWSSCICLCLLAQVIESTAQCQQPTTTYAGGPAYDCSGQSLTAFPSNFDSTATLIDVSDNQITILTSGAFASLTQLQVLNISNNELSTLEAVFTGLINLRIVHLDNNFALASLPLEIIDDQAALEEFSLQSTSVPDCIFRASDGSSAPLLHGSCGREFGNLCIEHRNCPITSGTIVSDNYFFDNSGGSLTSRTCRGGVCCNAIAAQESQYTCQQCSSPLGECFVSPLAGDTKAVIATMIDWSGSYSNVEAAESIASSKFGATEVLTFGRVAFGLVSYDFEITRRLGYPFTMDAADVVNDFYDFDPVYRGLTGSDLPRALQQAAQSFLNSELNNPSLKALFITADQLDFAACVNLSATADCLVDAITTFRNDNWSIFISWEKNSITEAEFQRLKQLSFPQDSRSWNGSGISPVSPAAGTPTTLFFPLLGDPSIGAEFSRGFSRELADIVLTELEVPPPTAMPTESPTNSPTVSPTVTPSSSPTLSPTGSPSSSPTLSPSMSPSISPTKLPTVSPSRSPSLLPTLSFPTASPTSSPSVSTTISPTQSPTQSNSPTMHPISSTPTVGPSTSTPTMSPTSASPTLSPTVTPTRKPTKTPTAVPTFSPSISPTQNPTSSNPTASPTLSPTTSPTQSPTSFPSEVPIPQAIDSSGATASGTAAVIIIVIIVLLIILYIIYIKYLAKPGFKPGDRVKVKGKAFPSGHVPQGTTDPAIGVVSFVKPRMVEVELDEPWNEPDESVRVSQMSYIHKIPSEGTYNATANNQVAPAPQEALPPMHSFTPDRWFGGSPEHENVVEQKSYDNGAKAFLYSNGTIKEVHNDGTLVYRYENGDKQTVFADEHTIYQYAAEGLIVSTWLSGEVVREFVAGPAVGQKETTYADGGKLIEYPDGTIKNVEPNGVETTQFLNGKTMTTDSNGDVEESEDLRPASAIAL